MRFLLFLFLTLLPFNSFSQYQAIEDTPRKDLILVGEMYDDKLYYYNHNRLLFTISPAQSTAIISGNLAYFDFTTKTITKTNIYAKGDSINVIIFIVKDNYDFMYTVRSLRESLNDLNPLYFLEKRSNDLSQVIESNEIFLSGNIDRIIHGFFDENDILQMKGFQVTPNFQGFHYSVTTNNVIHDFPTVNTLDQYHFHSINDSTFLSFSYLAEQIIYHKKDTFEITESVELHDNPHFINEKSVVLIDNLYLNGRINQQVWGQPNRHIVYKHVINSDTAVAIFIDSTEQLDAQHAARSIDLIDSNFIYSGSNYGQCQSLSSYDCLSSFNIFCVSSQGTLNWKKNIGGDGNYWLYQVYATADTGCFALYYKFVEEDSAKNGDMYWVKYDKYGNEEPDYLNEFYLSTALVEPLNSVIIVYPNPTTNEITITLNKELTEKAIINIYNLSGQMVINTKYQQNIDISSLEVGMYIIDVVDETGSVFRQKISKI